MKLFYVLLACAGAAIVSAVPYQDTPLVTRHEHGDRPHDHGPHHRHHGQDLDNNNPSRREIEVYDLFVRALDEEFQTRDIEYPDGLVERDLDENLERRLFKWYHKMKAKHDDLQAMKYQQKADRQRAAMGSGGDPSGGNGAE